MTAAVLRMAVAIHRVPLWTRSSFWVGTAATRRRRSRGLSYTESPLISAPTVNHFRVSILASDHGSRSCCVNYQGEYSLAWAHGLMQRVSGGRSDVVHGGGE